MSNHMNKSKTGGSVRQKAFCQAVLLILISGLAALGANHLRAQSLPLIGRWSPEARLTDDSGQSEIIGLTRASRMFAENQAVFLDARPASEYRNGHIQGALNLPWEEVDSRFMQVGPLLEDKEAIITYCDGANCMLSHDLSVFLRDMGFENVHVLVNGWTVWKDAGLPVESRGPEIG